MNRFALSWLMCIFTFLLLAVFVVSNLNIRTDLSFFLPENTSLETSLLSSALQSDQGGSLLLIGLDGTNAKTLAKASQDIAQRLEQSQRFHFIANGTPRLSAHQILQVRKWRYIIGPSWNEQSFSQTQLSKKLKTSIYKLASTQGWAFRDQFAYDPLNRMGDFMQFGAFNKLPEYKFGVWMEPKNKGYRALIMAYAIAPASDFIQQNGIRDLLNSSASPWAEQGVHLQSSGVGLFALDIRQYIKSEMQVLSGLATVLVLGFLGLVFRRFSILILLSLPLCAAIIMGAGMVQLLFGYVHGVALTFGATLIGVAVDYPIHLFTHQRRGETAQQSVTRLAKPLALSALTTIAGFLVLSQSSFYGLAQLGVLAGTGIFTAAMVSYWILPHLMGPNLRAHADNTSSFWGQILVNQAFTKKVRMSLAIVSLGIVVMGLQTSSPIWENDLSNLSPISKSSKDLDRDLRAALRAPDVRHMIIVTGKSADDVLKQQEKILPALQSLVQHGQLNGFSAAASLLPSQSVQQDRQDALPDRITLNKDFKTATIENDLDFNLFKGFIDEISQQKNLSTITANDFFQSPLGWRLSPILQKVDNTKWMGRILLNGPKNIAALKDFNSGDDVVKYVDLKMTANTIVTQYREEAILWLYLGGAVSLLCLILGFMNIRHAILAALPAASAIGVTVCALLTLGVSLSLFHLLALLMVAGIGIDYALFFNTFQGSQEDHKLSLRAIILCNVTTILVFAVLAFSTTPVLSGIGLTVSIGAAFSLMFTFAYGNTAKGVA